VSSQKKKCGGRDIDMESTGVLWHEESLSRDENPSFPEGRGREH
jgi:hypothetical protein